jgi:DNA-binding response OmpR family regulator
MSTAVAPFRRVLIVEDEALLRRVIARNLAGRGLEVREADSAEAAVSAVAEERPDLLLLDINLPDRTGWEVLRELNRRDSGVPTIVMSAVRARPSRLDEFRPLAYLPKPFPLESLLRLVLEPASEPSIGDDA